MCFPILPPDDLIQTDDEERIYKHVKVSRICNVPHVLLFWSFLQCVSLILVIPSSFHYQYITSHALLFFLLVCLGPLCKRRILFSFISNCSIFLARIAELFYFLYWLPDHCLSIIYSHWHKTSQCLYLPDIHFPCIKHVKENNKNLSKYSYLLFLVIFNTHHANARRLVSVNRLFLRKLFINVC